MIATWLLQEIAAVTPLDDRSRVELRTRVYDDEEINDGDPREMRVVQKDKRHRAAPLEITERQAAVVGVLRASPGSTIHGVVGELAARGVDLAYDSVRDTLARMRMRGVVRRVDRKGERSRTVYFVVDGAA